MEGRHSSSVDWTLSTQSLQAPLVFTSCNNTRLSCNKTTNMLRLNVVVTVVVVMGFFCFPMVYGSRYQRIEEFEGDKGVILESCDRTYTIIAGQCYKFHQSMRRWEGARDECESEGAQLASVLTQDQYDGILSHINANFPGTYWLSGRAVQRRWVWTSTNPMTEMATQWWGREASTAEGQCAYFCSNTLKYWNKSCGNSLRFICEKTPTLVGGFDPRVDAV